MTEVAVKNPAGKDAGTVTLDDSMFGVRPNVALMHQVVTAQLARRRAGTQSTKTRSEVRGGGAKPYRQKGTGNSRQGSTNAPHYNGGGIALGPKPRSYAQRTPKKMIKQALRSALSDRAGDGKILVVDAWNFSAPRTKDASATLTALGLDGRVLVVIERYDANAALSFRNIAEVQVIHAGELNAYDVLCNDWIVFTKSSLSFVRGGTVDPERSDDDTQAGLGSASDEPDASASERSGSVTALAPERSDDDTQAGVGSASDQPDASASEPLDTERSA